jgi:hypothetical protein
VEAARPVRCNSLPLVALELTRPVGRAYDERVLTRRRRLPREAPERPREGRPRVVEPSVRPCAAVVGAHLDASDAAVPREGDPIDRDGRRARERLVLLRRVDSRHRVDPLRPPTLPFVVALDLLGPDLDAVDPLHAQLAVAAGVEEADGKAMPVGKRLAVHLVREELRLFERLLERRRVRVAVRGVKEHPARVLARPRLLEQRPQADAPPLGVAHEAAPDRVRDALERRLLRHRPERRQLLEAVRPLAIDEAAHLEPPAVFRDARVDEVLRHDVELVVRRDRRDVGPPRLKAVVVERGAAAEGLDEPAGREREPARRRADEEGAPVRHERPPFPGEVRRGSLRRARRRGGSRARRRRARGPAEDRRSSSRGPARARRASRARR